MKPKPIEIPIAAGGKLLSDLSAESVGAANWTVKRDFRRVLEREERSEGYVKFTDNHPSTSDPIILTAEAELDSGKRVTVVGTATTLWRYCSEPDTGYVLPGYVASGYVDNTDHTGEWLQIGTGFTGVKWEAWIVGNHLVLNNGVDLPVTYRAGALTVEPIYELREQGVVSVGTIAEVNGILWASNLRQLVNVEDYMAPIPSAVSCGQTAGGYTLSAPAWSTATEPGMFEGIDAEDLIGRQLVWDAGPTRYIKSISEAGVVTVDDNGGITSGAVRLSPEFTYGSVVTTPPLTKAIRSPFQAEQTGGATKVTPKASELFPGVVSSTLPGRYLFWESGAWRRIVSVDVDGYIQVHTTTGVAAGNVSLDSTIAYSKYVEAFENAARVEPYRWRHTWSLPQNPRRFGAVYYGRMEAGTVRVNLTYPPKGLSAGMSLLVVGAGLNGGNLISEILSVDGCSVYLANKAITSVGIDGDPTPVSAYDAVGGIAGKHLDTIGMGGEVVRALPLGSYLIVYKSTPEIFLVGYTGVVGEPFTAERVNQAPFPESSILAHPDTLVSVSGEYHVYAGADGFYRFDLTKRIPLPVLELMPCKDVFFKATGRKFAAENGFTKEVFFCFPDATGTDKALRYDYQYGTVSTTSMRFSSARMIHKPGADEYWFAMGMADGKLMRYGLDKAGSAIFNRDGATYQSVMKSGLDPFRSHSASKTLNQYVPVLGEGSTDTPITVTVLTANQPGQTPTERSRVLAHPLNGNLIPCGLKALYVGDQLVIDGKDNPMSITQRIFWVTGADSRNIERRVA